MKKILFTLLCMPLLGAVPAFAGGINLNLNVHLGDQREAPVIVNKPPVIVSEPPLFLQSATLGLQVSVGNSNAIFLLGGRYFLLSDRHWFVAPGYGGPWTVIRHDRLPPGLAKRNNREILALRSEEYERYRHGRYHGRTFRPGRAEHGWGKGHGRHGWK